MNLPQMIKSDYFKHKIKSAVKYKIRGLPNYKIAQRTDLPIEIIRELDERKILNLEDLEVIMK